MVTLMATIVGAGAAMIVEILLVETIVSLMRGEVERLEVTGMKKNGRGRAWTSKA